MRSDEIKKGRPDPKPEAKMPSNISQDDMEWLRANGVEDGDMSIVEEYSKTKEYLISEPVDDYLSSSMRETTERYGDEIRIGLMALNYYSN